MIYIFNFKKELIYILWKLLEKNFNPAIFIDSFYREGAGKGWIRRFITLGSCLCFPSILICAMVVKRIECKTPKKVLDT